jgi:hypothetical protein
MDIFQTEAAGDLPGDQAERRHQDDDHDAERVSRVLDRLRASRSACRKRFRRVGTEKAWV